MRYKMDKKNRTLIDLFKEDLFKELEQKANRTGQFHLDAINEKFANLKSEDTALFDKIDALEKKINDNKDNCVSNNNYKKLWEENTKDYNDLARERLEDYTKIEFVKEDIDNNGRLLQDATRKIFARMDSIDDNINRLEDRVLDKKALDIAFKESAEDYDALESKYYTLRSELDAVYKVLEMDALDIQDLYSKLENHPKKDIFDKDGYDINGLPKKYINGLLDKSALEEAERVKISNKEVDRYTLECDNKEIVNNINLSDKGGSNDE